MVHELMLVQVKRPEDSKYPWDYYQKVLSEYFPRLALSKRHISPL
jgi:hypothetical protein